MAHLSTFFGTTKTLDSLIQDSTPLTFKILVVDFIGILAARRAY
ncbi:hypothetical protein CCACVL1_07576 [Corchorus capsularis]|uniref:Uncharacterized protein n=1 Tax=Corchorus capsularis TaxID=210143 RepID=A0A1R3J539_COCAP|nr:hypothetical protein CCACVL1_07576 [Corchorus capsularis]